MRVLCGGEDEVMGVYGGELLPDPHEGAKNRLVRVDAIYEYPRQRAIITDSIMERRPLPYGAVVRLRVLGPCERPAAQSIDIYEEMVKEALERLTAAYRASGDDEILDALNKRGCAETEISGSYCRR